MEREIILSAGYQTDVNAAFVILASSRSGCHELLDSRRYYSVYYTVLGAKLFYNSLQLVKSVNASWEYISKLQIDGTYYNTERYHFPEEDKKLSAKLARLRVGYEPCHMSFDATPNLKSIVFGVTAEDFCEGLYEKLMRLTNLPLKKEWMGYVLRKLEENGYANHNVFIVTANDEMTFKFEGKEYLFKDLTGYSFNETQLSNENILQILQKGIHDGDITLTPSGECMPPLVLIGGLDTYRRSYGEQFVENVKKLVKPYTELKGGVEECFLSGKKRLYKQQGAIVNAVAQNFFHHREPTAWLIEQMGSGKSIQAISCVEETFALRYLATHPGTTPEDAHSKASNISYRAIIMAPGHLVSKWGKEVEENIPYATVRTINSLADCEAIRARGHKRNGKEIYVVGKDLAKLGCTEMPAVNKVISRKPIAFQCRRCHHTYNLAEARKAIKNGKCKSGWCRSQFNSLNDFKQVIATGYEEEGKYIKGLQCPSCGRLMYYSENQDIPMMPWHFMNKTVANSHCNFCGESLWKPLVKNLNNGTPKESKWYKVSFFKNKTMRDTDTGWVMEGYEDKTYAENNVIKEGLKKSNPAVLRKWAPSRFIKEQLKDYFDFAIFDELHQYKEPGTAQAIAMHAVARASRQTIGLTGTIAGGFADDLFYTIWRLDPHIMVDHGYTFYGETGEKAFTAKYGTLETQLSVNNDGTVNKMSRGGKKGDTKPKPGISPDIFSDILMPICVFLDLTDMSNKLPDLHEKVVSVKMDADVKDAYSHSLDCIKRYMGNTFGLNALSSEMLLFSLLYQDSPFGYREKIIDPKTGSVVHIPTVFPENRLYPKEKEMLQIINSELDEGRNVFVYLEYTGSGLPERYKKLICDYCGLSENEVGILKSTSPSAAMREEWIHKKAAQGVKVFLTHPKCVETGLDFIFEYQGCTYNYPTLIFAECGTNLFTLWQASRRHFRLNQTEECRTYYLCYEDTAQAKVIRLMAEKQVATSSIQGKFNMEGLRAMAETIDPRLILMKALMEDESSAEDAEKASKIFANLNENTGIDESIYGPSVTRLFSEVYNSTEEVPVEISGGMFDDIFDASFTEIETEEVAEKENDANASDFFDNFFAGDIIVAEDNNAPKAAEVVTATTRRKRKSMDENQIDAFEFFKITA